MASLQSDENDTSEVSDSNTHSSPSKYNSKERDDLKEKLKAEKKAAKKLVKEMAICKIMLEEMEVI
jgi:ABC-type oligopeptide transport system substrate-binding subunit